MTRTTRILLGLALLPALAAAEPTPWKIDPAHTQTSFTVRHMGLSNVRGEFKSTNGAVAIDEKDPARSSVDVTIDARTINTREDKRDAHLRSPDFLDVERFPEITFKSRKVAKKGDGWEVTGDLTLRGVTKPVVLKVSGLTPEVKDPTGALRRGAHGTTKISRQEFGLQWNKMVEAVPVVGDEVTIEVDAELVRQPGEGGKRVEAEAKPAPAGRATN